MWTKFKASKIINNEKQQIRNKSQKSFNVNEEYLCTLRTKSFIEFFTKAELIVHESPPCTSSSSTDRRRRRTFSETVRLQPGQLEAISSILESPFLALLPDLRGLLIDFFNFSAEASDLCNRLLANLKLARSNSNFIHQLLDSFEKCSSHRKIEAIASDLLALRAPFSDLDKIDFALIQSEYAAVSYQLNYTRKKVARKIKSMKIVDRFTCGLIAIASRTLSSLVMAAGPDPKLLRHRGLERVGEQVEAAAKGSYIVNRELETASRLVVRLGGAVDHGKAMVQLFVERKEGRFAVAAAMDELKKSNVSIGKQVEDVEEHLYLCIVAIDKTRASVINQMYDGNGTGIHNGVLTDF